MNSQPYLIHTVNWDFLVILDACRYDYFNEIYPCKKAISPATGTPNWLSMVWPSYYDDIVYVSGNPWINNVEAVVSPDGVEFDGRKHFFKVVDAHWSNRLGTTHPLSVNKAFHRAYLKYPDKKFILHYMQPHRPYICLGGYPTTQKTIVGHVHRNLFRTIFNKLPVSLVWRIFPNSDIEYVRLQKEIFIKEGFDGLKKIYQKEIQLAMSYIEMLMEAIDGTWVVTADHGERFDFWKIGSHGGKKRLKSLIEVPWYRCNYQNQTEHD